jgi:hypothetical protein
MASAAQHTHTHSGPSGPTVTFFSFLSLHACSPPRPACPSPSSLQIGRNSPHPTPPLSSPPQNPKPYPAPRARQLGGARASPGESPTISPRLFIWTFFLLRNYPGISGFRLPRSASISSTVWSFCALNQRQTRVVR